MIGRDQLASILVKPGTSILDAVKAIEAGGMQVVLVSADGEHLDGIVTDGDIRRGLLRGVPLESNIGTVMNAKPASLRSPATREQAVGVMNRQQVRQLPVIDADGRLVGLYHLDRREGPVAVKDETWVVIMAGGRGTRLHPLTHTTPKPMLPIGGKPLVETLIRSLVDQDFRRIYLSINYMADMFKGHFGDGSHYGADIRYIEETSRLGTAGALGLLDEVPPGPVLVMNGDLLTAVNFNNLLAYHKEHCSLATMCVRDYRVQIPFGVIEMDGGRVSSIEEKPEKVYFVNAGIYVLNPSLIGKVQRGQYLDMTTLLKEVLAEGGAVGSFPIHEYWLDVGRMDDLERAQTEFDKVFGA